MYMVSFGLFKLFVASCAPIFCALSLLNLRSFGLIETRDAKSMSDERSDGRNIYI